MLPDARLQVVQERSPKARHGRLETRTLWALESADLNAYVGCSGKVGKPWPGVAQALRIQRVVRRKTHGSELWRVGEEVGYAITSLDSARTCAEQLLKRWQVHWHIENRLHWVLDVTLSPLSRSSLSARTSVRFTLARRRRRSRCCARLPCFS